jgi:hypothetical protein
MAKPAAWPPKPLEGHHNLRLVLHLGQRLQIRCDILPVQSGALAGYYRLYIQHVARPEREEFEDDQVFSRAGSQDRRCLEFEQGRPLHQTFLKGQCRQCDIDRNAVRRLKQQDSISASELAGIRDPSHVPGVQQRRGNVVLAPERTQQREVNVSREPRFAPTQHRETSDETESPAMRLEQCLKIAGRLE